MSYEIHFKIPEDSPRGHLIGTFATQKHISKQTRDYLATRPSRSAYVHTPKHGSWLNLAENLFGKMAKTFLRHIRVASKQELKDRIKLGIAEMNAQPVLFRWTKFDAVPESV